ncbi:MAG: diaminopimelate epimerase [Cyanobacteria bacterium P01_F01_bin.42]
MQIDFTKYQGLGNDFILIDNRRQSAPGLSPEQAVQLCDRHFGIGGDGVIFLLLGDAGADYTMRIYNSDGSEPEMCGNGVRCLTRFIAQLEGRSPEEAATYTINTQAGLIQPQLLADGQVRVNMGVPRLGAAEIPTTLRHADAHVIGVPLVIDAQEWTVTCVGMGNPHCVTFVSNADAIDLAALGPKFEHHPQFPQRINTEFIEVINRDRLKMRVWERGAGMTLACGTGACASLVAAVLSQKSDRTATVELPGGPLKIEWPSDESAVYMTGAATHVFDGRVEI